MSGSGFAPGTTVRVWAIPQNGGTPIELASLGVTPFGAFLGSSGLQQLGAGAYTLQANGLAADGSVRSTNLGVSVTAPGTLPATGGDDSTIWFAIGLLWAGAVALWTSKRRQPTGQVASVS